MTCSTVIAKCWHRTGRRANQSFFEHFTIQTSVVRSNPGKPIKQLGRGLGTSELDIRACGKKQQLRIFMKGTV